jgi:hypothetical protein
MIPTLIYRWLAKRPTLVALITLSLLWVVFFWRLITPAAEDRVVFIGGDFDSYYYATASYQSERLWEGQLPLWDPYSAAGLPFGAGLESGTWYPLRWLAIVIAGPGGWSHEVMQIEVAFRYWLASLMAYALFRRLTRHPVTALAGSVMYAYGGYLAGYPMPQVSILDSAMWLPLALLGAQLATEKSPLSAGQRQAWGGALLAGAALGMSILAGHPQTTMLCMYLTLAYLAFAAWRNRIGWIGTGLRGLVVVAGFVAFAAILLLPAAELTANTARLSAYTFDYKGGGYALAELLQVAWPGVFVGFWSPLYPGVAALILTIGALMRPRPERVFWGAALLIGLLLSTGASTSIYQALYAFVPGFDVFRQQERVGVVVAMAFATLATLHIDTLAARPGDPDHLNETERKRFTNVATGHLLIAIVAAVLISIGTLVLGMPAAPTANWFSFVALISAVFSLWLMFFRQNQNFAASAGLVLIIALDLFTVGLNTANFLPDIPENHVYVVRPPRLRAPEQVVWHVDGSGGVMGFGLYFRIPDFYNSSSGLELKSIAGHRTMPVDRLWEVLAVRYATLLDGNPLPEQTPLTLLSSYPNRQGELYNVFELQDPRPFAWLVYDSRGAGSAEFARQIMADPRVDLREMAVTLNPLPLELPGQRPEVSTISNFARPTPERIEMSISTGENALLTLALPDYPGWRATLNGQPVEIIDNYAGLVGVPIPAGENQTVVVEFVPVTQLIGAIISLVTWLGMIGYWVLMRRARPGITASK